MAVVQAGYAGALQNNPLGVDSKSLYDAYNNQRIESRNDQIAYAQKLDDEWNNTFMPAIVNMMNSKDPNVKDAAEKRYMQGVVAYANSRGVKLSDGDMSNVLNEFRARYSEGGMNNLEINSLGGPEDGVGGGGDGGSGSGSTSHSSGASAQIAQAPVANAPRSEPSSPAQNTSLPPPAKPSALTLMLEGFAKNYSGNPLSGWNAPSVVAPPGTVSYPHAPVVGPDSESYKQLYETFRTGRNTPSQLRAMAAQYRANRLPDKARAAEDAANALEAIQRSPKIKGDTDSRRKREGFASKGVALPGPNGEPVEATLAENEPEAVVSLDTANKYGAQAALDEAIESKIIQGGPNVPTTLTPRGAVQGGSSPQGIVSGNNPRQKALSESDPPEVVDPSTVPDEFGSYMQRTAPSTPAPSPTLPAPLVKANARTKSITDTLATKAQDLLTKAQGAKSDAEAKRSIQQSYFAIDRIARIASSTPEYKQVSADTKKKWAAWVNTATPEQLAAVGLKNVSDARSNSLDRSSRERIAFAQIAADKEMKQYQIDSVSEQTRRTMSQVLESMYKSGIEDVVVKKYGGDINKAIKSSPTVAQFYTLKQFVEQGTVNEEQVSPERGFFGGEKKIQVPVTKGDLYNQTKSAVESIQANEVTRDKNSGGGSGAFVRSGTTGQKSFSQADLDTLAKNLAAVRGGK